MRRAGLDSDLLGHRLPQPAEPALHPQAFCLCPAGMVPGIGGGQWFMVQQIYQVAFAQAQAVARPSLLERDLLGVWN
jgi:hypothetical protein